MFNKKAYKKSLREMYRNRRRKTIFSKYGKDGLNIRALSRYAESKKKGIYELSDTEKLCFCNGITAKNVLKFAKKERFKDFKSEEDIDTFLYKIRNGEI